MVGRWPPNRGATRLGCLFTLLVLAVVGYFGLQVGTVYWHRYQLWDEMNTQASFAGQIADAAIRRRLIQRVEQLGLPAEARRVRITREARPRAIRIRIIYDEKVELPFYVQPIHIDLSVTRRF